MPVSAILVFALLLLQIAVSHCATVTATGCFKCRDTESGLVHIKFAKVTLFDDDTLSDDSLSSGTTDAAGCYTLTGTGGDGIGLGGREPDAYVRLYYEHSSTRGMMKILKFSTTPLLSFPFFRQELQSQSTRTRSDVEGTVDFGTIMYANDACVNYVHFLEAVDFYSTNSGKALPYGTLKVTVGVLGVFNTILPRLLNIPQLPDEILRVPFAPYDQVIVPAGYHMNANTAKHEFAHTVRHVLDGSFAHWLFDVKEYQYPQFHRCTKKTNEGFAFNEGWANWNYGSNCGDASGPKDIEGNVAVALKALQARCGLDYKAMWAVLEDNPGIIHSYAQFAQRACPAPVTGAPPVATVPLPRPPAPPAPSSFVVCTTRPRLELYSGYASRGQGALQPAVKELQRILDMQGESLTIDGFFGEQTRSAVKAYQSTNGLLVDGIVGNETWRSLCG